MMPGGMMGGNSGPSQPTILAAAAAAASAYTDAAVLDLLQDTYFGDGSDGSIVYSLANSRWEDGSGNALASVGGKWTVSGTTLILLRDFQFQNVTFQTVAYIISGTDGQQNAFHHRVRGTLTGYSGAKIRASYWLAPTASLVAPGAAKTTAGAGNNPAATGVSGLLVAGPCGGSGAGGGDGTNAGGRGVYDASTLNAPGQYYGHATGAFGGVLPAGGTGAGSTGLSGNALANLSVSWRSVVRSPGQLSPGGGGGALKQAGGANTSGVGGLSARGGGIMDWHIYELDDVAGFIICSDGEGGGNGGDGVAANAAGDISGGGGGAGGAGGGTVVVCYGPGGRTGAGTIRAAGGPGGTGGLGYEYNASARPTSNGGNGAAGSDGVAVIRRIG